jgi:hypothetical protein
MFVDEEERAVAIAATLVSIGAVFALGTWATLTLVIWYFGL